MAFSYRDFFFGGTTFCCCLKVRLGVAIMTVVGMLFAGLLSILLWFEVSTSTDIASKERTAFILAGLLETLLFVASILGFVGVIVRKQLFVQIYAYFIYVHLVVNFAVAAYLLYMLVHVSTTDQIDACQKAIKNTGAQDQCTGLFKIALGVYAVVASVVLMTELYGAIVVARYVNQIQREKRNVRASRIGSSRSSSRKGTQKRYFKINDPVDPHHDGIPLRSASPHASEMYDRMYDPYEEAVNPKSSELGHSRASTEVIHDPHHDGIPLRSARPHVGEMYYDPYEDAVNPVSSESGHSRASTEVIHAESRPMAEHLP
ncbi:hypothetical protein GGX14DRAFT_599074 [Mycena pura]|uniref:Uncharacterized protein n=1 Tax=Mycena pura TaxID=153505 RepID=A0AAD6VS47_9AGAR|nr:hypothetical protein GGX14DRAFT_599074 [Mycena pura]